MQQLQALVIISAVAKNYKLLPKMSMSVLLYKRSESPKTVFKNTNQNIAPHNYESRSSFIKQVFN